MNSDRTFAFATSAKRPDKKSELYDERFTESRSWGLVERFRRGKRTPVEAGKDSPTEAPASVGAAVATVGFRETKIAETAVILVVCVVYVYVNVDGSNRWKRWREIGSRGLVALAYSAAMRNIVAMTEESRASI